MAKIDKEKLEVFYAAVEDRTIAKLKLKGLTSKEIGEMYGISGRTVQRYGRIRPKQEQCASKEEEFILTPLRRFALCEEWKL